MKRISPQYDAIVIGAGPAGSMAAFEIAAAGFAVLLLEKHKQVGLPLCCAEAVSRPALDRIIIPRREWISADINRVRLVAPDGEEMALFHENAGYVLDRKAFDSGLADRAVEAGSQLECEAIGLELLREGDKFRAIKVIESDTRTIEVSARIFIAADGVESRIARLAGLDNVISVLEAEALLQYRLQDVEVESDTVEFHVGNEVAPGSYVWVFPKSATSANVGLGVEIESHKGSEAAVYLKRFIEKKFPRATIAESMCGLVPKYQGKKMFRLGNLLVVGDAARAVDSFSGAGIVSGMLSGKYAGLAAVEYLSGRVRTQAHLEDFYPGRFLREKGEELALYGKLRKVYRKLDDKDFIEITVALRDFFQKNDATGVSAARLMAGLVKTRPRLIRHARHLL
jgi:digeranylgeranylglycerophospholipid reductase